MSTTGLIPSNILLGLGQGLSITGLVLVMPFFFAFRTYLRFLDHLQLLFVYSLVLVATGSSKQSIFSSYLGNSWVNFDLNIFSFCTTGEFVCTAGFALSFGACLLVFLLVMRLIVLFEQWRKKQIRFQPVYTFFKGLTRWVYAPLSFWSVYFLISSIKGINDSLIAAIVILAICILYPLIQLIGFKIIQSETQKNIWRKWLQFVSFYRLLLICGLMAIGYQTSNSIPYYFAYGVQAVYAILFLIFHTFYFKIVGRIVFAVGEALMIVIFSFFLFKQSYITDFNLDFIFVGAVIIFDVIYYIVQLVAYIIKGVPEDQVQKVTPEPSIQNINLNGKQKQKQKQSLKKNQKSNPYEVGLSDSNNEFNGSRDDLYTKQKTPNVRKNKNRYYGNIK